MRNSTYLLVIALAVSLSCESPATKTTLSGTISNPVGDLVELRFDGHKLIDTLNNQLSFSYELDLKSPQRMRLKHGDEYTNLHLKPGDQVKMTFDAAEFDQSVAYTGVGAEESNYLANVILYEYTMLDRNEMYALDEQEFLDYLDSLRIGKLALLDSNNVSDELFRLSEKDKLGFEQAANKLSYEVRHKSILELDSFTVSGGFYDFMENIDINDSSKLAVEGYKGYVDAVLSKEAFERYSAKEDQGPLTYYTTRLNTVRDLISDNTIKEIFLFQLIQLAFSTFENDARDELIEEWKSLNPPPKNISEYETIVGKWEVTRPGKPAPDFNYVTIDGDSLTMASFRGNLVYIDVWATWCKPCIAEHPAMEQLQLRFKDKPVTFLAVSIDSKPDPWRKMVAAKELGGVHLYAPGAWRSSIIEDYGINGIPRFILIDGEGNIIDADAPRPSGNIAELIAAHLART